MPHKPENGEGVPKPRVLSQAPEELTRGRLLRLGEGIGKVVYASERWVVKRKRRPSEILALIVLWKALRALDHLLPGKLGRRMLEQPGRQIRLLRVLFQAIVLAVPRGIWAATHIGRARGVYTSRDVEGERLAETHLAGTALVPERVTFPPTRVKVGGWPGWLVVSEATERVEMTLHDRINDLARAQRFDEIEVWLERFLNLRRAGWERGVFSLDAHLKNYGVTADRVVLLDPGGLTNRWAEIEHRLGFDDEFTSPHVELGMDMTLRDRPDIAERFDAHWRANVNPEKVRQHWQAAPAGRVERIGAS